MPQPVFERPAAQAIIAGVLMQDSRKEKRSEESTRRLIRKSGSESLSVSGSALAVSGEIIVCLRQPGFECDPPICEWIGFILFVESPLPSCCEWNMLLAVSYRDEDVPLLLHHSLE